MKNQPLQRQFQLWTILLVVVPSLLIMAIYTIGQIHIARQKNLELISQRVEFQERLIEAWIEERANDVRNLSHLESFRTLDESQMKHTLDLMQRHSPDFDSLSYINKDGFFRMSTLSSGIRFTSTSGQPYFQAAQEGKEYISDVVIGRNSGLPIINFASPVYDRAGGFQGLILGSVSTKTIETLLRDNWMGQTGEILLVNREGTMLIEPRYIDILIKRGVVESTSKMKVKLSADALENIRLSENGSASWLNYLGNKVLGAYRYMPDRGWTLVGSINEEEILVPIYNQLGIMAGSTLLLILLILPVATLVTNRIKRPIEWLIRQSDLVAVENYQMVGRHENLENAPHELHTLCKTFVNMSRKIENTVRLLKENDAKLQMKMLEIQDINAALEEEIMERQAAQAALYQLNAELEDKVRDRTSQLQEINATLEEEIMERQVAQEALSQKTSEIQKMAYTDALTGLPNRAHLNKKLTEVMEEVRWGYQAGAVLFIDIDNLKMINDTLGHSYGDDVIKKAGAYILAEAGESAEVARIGGDEFIVLLTAETDREKIAHVADNMVRLLSRDYEIGESKIHMSASIGIARYPFDGATAEDILKNADLALYAAKGSGKNTWRFYETNLQVVAYENMSLKRGLRDAIRNEEFSLHYQPLVDAKTGQVISFEALLRWTSPVYGFVSPNRFIPLAEETDTIQQIGKWVIEEACRFARTLADLGKEDIRVSVNVSPRQLVANEFVEVVRKALENAGIKPSQLEIEITENVMIASLEDCVQKLIILSTLGVRLSLDDFGTGYSSLTYLRRLPVTTLKIDKSFVDQIVSDDTQLQFICSIVNMAHVLQLTVVAEGVENEAQLEKLVECQCDFIQGYFFSRPVPPRDAIKLLVG